MNEIELAWLAGLLEGEGCFSYSGSAGVRLGMTDLDVVEKVAKLLGKHVRGPYKYKGNVKPVFYTELYGDRAIDLMKSLLPYMGKRRSAKIREVIDLKAKAPGRGHKKGCGRKPDCHIDREHYANGMCRRCYVKDRRSKGARW